VGLLLPAKGNVVTSIRLLVILAESSAFVVPRCCINCCPWFREMETWRWRRCKKLHCEQMLRVSGIDAIMLSNSSLLDSIHTLSYSCDHRTTCSSRGHGLPRPKRSAFGHPVEARASATTVETGKKLGAFTGGKTMRPHRPSKRRLRFAGDLKHRSLYPAIGFSTVDHS